MDEDADEDAARVRVISQQEERHLFPLAAIEAEAISKPLVEHTEAPAPAADGLEERQSIPLAHHVVPSLTVFVDTTASLCRIDQVPSMPASEMALTRPSSPV